MQCIENYRERNRPAHSPVSRGIPAQKPGFIQFVLTDDSACASHVGSIDGLIHIGLGLADLGVDIIESVIGVAHAEIPLQITLGPGLHTDNRRVLRDADFFRIILSADNYFSCTLRAFVIRSRDDQGDLPGLA